MNYSDEHPPSASVHCRPRLGVVSLLLNEHGPGYNQVESILGEHASLLLARFDHSFQEKCILCLLIRATTDELGALTGKLGMLREIRVKSFLLE